MKKYFMPKINISYQAIIKRSWELTKKNKWLWVYGLALIIFGGSSGNGGGGGGGSSSQKTPKEAPADLPEKTSQVLGQTADFLQQIKDWAASVPVYIWVLIVLGILAVAVVYVAIAWMARSWAKSGLIIGLEMADKGETATLANTSSLALGKTKKMMVLGLISALMFFLLIVGVMIAMVTGVILAKISPLAYLIMIIAGLVFIILSFLMGVLSIYAERLVVLHYFSPWEAWKTGFYYSRMFFIPTVKMGCLNNLIGCGVGCLVIILLGILLGIPGAVIFIPIFKNGFVFTKLIWGIASMSIFLFLFAWAGFLIQAVFAVFKFGTWNLFFKQIYDFEQNNKSK